MGGFGHWGHSREAGAGLMGALGAFPSAHSHQHPQGIAPERGGLCRLVSPLSPLLGTPNEEQDIKCHRPSGMKAHKPYTQSLSIGKQVAGTPQGSGCGQPLPCCAHRGITGAVKDTNGWVEHSSL